MAYCDKCGAYISSGDRCTDCANYSHLVDAFVDYLNEQNRRTYVTVGDSASRNSDDDTSGYNSSINDDKRNGFVSFIFALVIGAGVCLSGYFLYSKLNLDNVYILTGIILTSLIAGIILTFIAWRNKKNVLFVIMLLLSFPGLVGLFNEIIKL